MRAFRSTSAIRKAHGSAAPTRIPTDCCDSIFRKAPISACIALRRSPPWPTPSTPGPGRLSTGKHPQRRLTSGFHRLTKTVLRRPFESAEYAYDLKTSFGRLDIALVAAAANNWTVVDMKRDWRRVFAFEA